MDEYIRRQAAIDAFNRIKNTLKNPETAHYDTLMFYEIEDVLEDVEPADVVPVVRCKDCKHMVFTSKAPNKARPGETHPDFYHCYKYRQFHPLIKPDSDFCSYGKRREE